MEAHARSHFVAVEAAFVLLTCGFFSALQQQSLSIRSEWLAWFSCVVVVPLTSLGCDAGLHFWLDGRQTRQLGVAALVFTVLSATFHWHMIRNGALLVGDEAHSLQDRPEADSAVDGDVFCGAGVVAVADGERPGSGRIGCCGGRWRLTQGLKPTSKRARCGTTVRALIQRPQIQLRQEQSGAEGANA